jgi:N-acetylglutamate synthase-like GNAT family acetyltransferase
MFTMNDDVSSFAANELGGSSDTFLVRGFQAPDRTQVLRLHAAVAASDSVDCNCTVNIDQIEEDYLSRPQDHFWVAEAHGEIIGTVAIRVHENVAHLHCLRAIDDSSTHAVRKGLVQVAAKHAHHHGCLKLVVHAQVDIGRAAAFLHRLGFEFSRHREANKQPLVEFYLNLYERPELIPNLHGRDAPVPGSESPARLL